MRNLKESLPQTEVVWGKPMWRQSWVLYGGVNFEDLKDLYLDGEKNHIKGSESRICSLFTEDIMYKNTTMINKRQKQFWGADKYGI